MATFPGGVWASYAPLVDLVDFWDAAKANAIADEVVALEDYLITTTRVKNTALWGPASGANAVPTWRAQVLADIPYTAQGTILRGGASAYEELAAETNGQVLIGDGTDITSRALLGADTPIATDALRGTVEFATAAETISGASAALCVTPAGLLAALPAVPAASLGVQLDGAGHLIMPAGGEIRVVNGTAIGIDAANERINFYTTGYIALMGADVGVGTATPTGDFDVGGVNATYAALITGAGKESIAVGGDLQGRIYAEGSSVASITLDDSGGTADQKMFIVFTAAEITSFAALTDAGAISKTFFTLDHATGDVGIGTAASPSANSGKVLFMGDNGANPTMGNNTAGFYGSDVAGTVEAFAIDEAGNQAQLTPHNYAGPVQPFPNTLHWSQYHANAYMGVEKWYDIERALLALEALTGETFIHTRQLPASERLNWAQEQGKRLRAALKRGKKYTMKSKPFWM